MSYITIPDIVRRLMYRKPHWFQGKPDVSIQGWKNQFGKLVFDFHDEVVSFGVYLHMNPAEILRLAELAVDVFPDMSQRICEQEEESWAAVR